MDDIKKEQFLLYARLKSEEKILKERIQELAGIILPEMLEIDGSNTKIETPLGNFSVKVLKKWTYPQEISDLDDDLKRKKKDAERNGSATFEESNSLYFRLGTQEE